MPLRQPVLPSCWLDLRGFLLAGSERPTSSPRHARVGRSGEEEGRRKMMIMMMRKITMRIIGLLNTGIGVVGRFCKGALGDRKSNMTIRN